MMSPVFLRGSFKNLFKMLAKATEMEALTLFFYFFHSSSLLLSLQDEGVIFGQGMRGEADMI